MGALEFEVTYDPQALEFVSLEQADLLPGALVSSNVPQPGRLIVALVSSAEVRGDGTLLVLKYKVLAKEPGAIALQIEKARAWEHGPELMEMLASTRPGQITVVGGPAISRWYIVVGAIGLLVVVALAMLLVLKARRTAPSELATHR
jgi:hypothetical protein